MTSDAIRWLTLPASELERLRAAVLGSLSKHPWAAAAWFYGSAARGGPARDIDIGVLAGPLPVEPHLASIAAEIALGLGLLPTDIDVRLVNGADPVFLGNMLRDAKLVFERDHERRIEFEVWAMNQWLDFQPVWERQRQRVLAGWSRG